MRHIIVLGTLLLLSSGCQRQIINKYLEIGKKDYCYPLYGRHYTYVVGGGEWYQNMKVGDAFLDSLLRLSAAVKIVCYNDVGKAKISAFEGDTTLLFNRGFVDFIYTDITMRPTDIIVTNIKNMMDVTSPDNIVHALSLEKGLMLCINRKERLTRLILINACMDAKFLSKMSKKLKKKDSFDSIIKVGCEGKVLDIWEKKPTTDIKGRNAQKATE